MPVLDRREPGVYVTIEDASYVAPSIESGRVSYVVALCDRGAHNRVLKYTSQPEFHSAHGKPDIRKCNQAFYLADKHLQYSNNLLFCRITPEDSYWSNTTITKSTASTDVVGDFTFVLDSNEVACGNVDSFDAVVEGDWIFAATDTIQDAAQVISKDSETNKLILDRNYTGVGGTGSAKKCSPYISVPVSNVGSIGDMPSTSTDVVYYFYAIGAGDYYNNIKIKGSRNISMEKMYMDDDGNILYPYLFMDIGVYYVNEDGSETLMEGPWTVSLIKRNPNNNIIKDLTSGRVMYIEDIVNKSSKLVRCISGSGVEDLIGTDDDAKDARLRVMLQLSISNPIKTQNIASGGIVFENGTNGTVDTDSLVPMYDNKGQLQTGDKIFGLIKQALKGTMTSVDGSIEQISEIVYPVYKFDYIPTGGYPADVQDGGRYLADYRQDCIHLGDTGGYKTSSQNDLDARLNDVPWNNWTSALYIQYREIKDEYTGEKIFMNPVYHALERNLSVDANYFIGEPVAGVEKGAITEPIQLAYQTNHTQRGDLLEAELNPVIVEPEGKYILTQYTTWKRLSILKRLHAAKFVAYVKQQVPPLLKDLLQRKGTPYWINQADSRIVNFLNRFTVGGPTERYEILTSSDVNVVFDDINTEINVRIGLSIIRVIEKITIFIVVN